MRRGTVKTDKHADRFVGNVADVAFLRRRQQTLISCLPKQGRSRCVGRRMRFAGLGRLECCLGADKSLSLGYAAARTPMRIEEYLAPLK